MAAPDDARAIGQRIAEARTRAGLTQAALASAVSLDRSSLAKVETGARRVSALELARISEAVRERIEWFLEDAPAAILSRRNLADPGAPSPRVDRQAESIARNVEFLMAQDDEFRLTSPQHLERPTTGSAAEVAAAQARALLGLNDREPFSDISPKASDVGLLIFSLSLGQEVADAASLLLSRGGIALVNGDLHVGRRRLAAAHELGHYLFADEFTIDWRLEEQEEPGTWESRLDRFARAVLLPEPGLRSAWDEACCSDAELRTAAVKLASFFRVDMSTLSRRLRELSLINSTDSNLIRQMRTTRSDIVEYNLVVPREFEPPNLPRLYERSVLRLYRSETISAARATGLLLGTWQEAELPSLPSLPEESIWKFVS